MKNFDAYVSKADGQQVKILAINNTLVEQLEVLGFLFDPVSSMYVKDVVNMTEKARLFSTLRDIGVCFSDGKEWCPSELFEYFRENKLLDGKFKRVSWSGPDIFTIKEV